MNKKKIILVDESTASQAALKTMFTQYDVVLAEDFAMTCEYLLEYRHFLELVVFNCQILAEDEWTTLIDKLKMFYPHTKLIAITETSEAQKMVEGYAVDDVFTEPIVRENIIWERVERVLNKS